MTTPAPDTPASAVGAADVVSKESFEKLQKAFEEEKSARAAADARAETNAARAASWQNEKKDELLRMQTQVTEGLSLLAQQEEGKAVGQARDLVSNWVGDWSNVSSYESTIPMAKVVAAFSGSLKRTLHEASAGKDASTELANTKKQLEEVTADRDTKALRITELEKWAKDADSRNEELNSIVKRELGIKETHNFSMKNSREDAAASSSAPAATATVPVGAAAAVNDSLAQFVRAQNPGGGPRLMQSGTDHNHVGTSADSGMSEVMAAISARGRGF